MSEPYPSQLLKPLSEYSLAEESEHAARCKEHGAPNSLSASPTAQSSSIDFPQAPPAPATIKSPAACVPRVTCLRAKVLAESEDSLWRRHLDPSKGLRLLCSRGARDSVCGWSLPQGTSFPLRKNVVNGWDLGFQQLPPARP